MAFGDGYNDISMLKYAGMGVVMGNANDTVKKKAITLHLLMMRMVLLMC